MRFNLKITDRWMGSSDLYKVLEIERWCFDHPWTHEDFIHAMRFPSYRLFVAEQGGIIVGYMVYFIDGSRVHLISLGVDPKHQRCKIGTHLIEKLKKTLGDARRVLVADVREENLDAQQFFKARKFFCNAIIRQRFDNDEDGYRFEFQPKKDEVKAIQTKEGVRWGR